jgi:indole-3-glycerol phosphate synthase
MATILDNLVAGARAETARRKRNLSLSDLEDRFGPGPLSLRDALSVEGLSIIAEAKRASPSQGVIRTDFDPAGIASEYEDAGAAAVSVLTEPLQFQGSLDHLREARAGCGLPLLRKDFIVDEYQLFEARAYGADAVLLIATVLDRHHLSDLLQAAASLGLECLVELYDARELDRLDFDLVRIVGVNNRDLRTFEVDRERAPAILASVPTDAVRVAESGLRTAEDLAFVEGKGMDAVLIGEAFMRAESPGAALKRLREDLSRLAEGS